MEDPTFSGRNPMSPSSLAALPNIGSVLAKELERIGVRTPADLRQLGSVEAAVRVAENGRTDCYSMLCALEGADDPRGCIHRSFPGERTDSEWRGASARHLPLRLLCASDRDPEGDRQRSPIHCAGNREMIPCPVVAARPRQPEAVVSSINGQDCFVANSSQ